MNLLLKKIRILKQIIALLILKLESRKKPIVNIIIHHTATSRDRTTFGAINNYHKRKWNYPSKLSLFCGYQYLITGKGKIHQARLDTEQGIHCKGHNDRTIGICLTGNFMKEKISKRQKKSLKILLDEKIKKYNLDKKQIKGHRDFRNTLCPGNNLMNWVENYKKY